MVLKAIFYDLDDTLVLTSEADKHACVAVCKLARKQCPTLDTARLLESWKTHFVAAPWDPEMKVPVHEWRSSHWQAALADQGFDRADVAVDMQSCFDDTRMSLFRFEPGVEDMVAEQRAGGLKAVIITNGHAQIQRAKLVACNAERLFDGVLVGGEEVAAGRAEKPHPTIFHSACRIAACEPHEAIHIGDSLAADIAGGTYAGLKATVWVNPRGLQPPECGPQPTHVVSHVTELRHVVDQLC